MTATPTKSTERRATAIEIEGLTKSYRKSSEPAKTFKERFLTWHRSTVNTFDALSDVSFTVHTGETFGILGHNGSGKSTLLKCIAGTIAPSSGTVKVRGRLSALLELGAGFHPDLTGRENVYLNGSILGMTNDALDEMFDEIFSFAELEDFVDTPVKHYSSGMYARLGFAIAVNVDPDILLVDEVLSVGDVAFQAKCLDRIGQFQARGRSLCLVTHSPDMVKEVCDRAIVLDHGNVLHLGDVDEAAWTYRKSVGMVPEGAVWAPGFDGRSENPTGDVGAGVIIADSTDLIKPAEEPATESPEEPSATGWSQRDTGQLRLFVDVDFLGLNGDAHQVRVVLVDDEAAEHWVGIAAEACITPISRRRRYLVDLPPNLGAGLIPTIYIEPDPDWSEVDDYRASAAVEMSMVGRPLELGRLVANTQMAIAIHVVTPDTDPTKPPGTIDE